MDQSGNAPAATSDSSHSTSSGLLARVKAGDGEAWRRLIGVYGPLVYQWCRHCALSPEDAADVAQEVFSAGARKVADFRRERPEDTFRGWLWTITLNKIRDQARRRQGEPRAQGGTEAQHRLAQILDQALDSTDAGLVSDCENSLAHRIVELARAGVEERTWQAFWRVAVDGEDAAVVAESLGISVQAVYDAKYRIRRKIRQQFEDLG